MLSIYETEQRRFAEEMLPHYLECAALTQNDDIGTDYFNDELDFASCAEESALSDCMSFVENNWELIKECRPEQVGHDFWLTRNHHGAGFWDRPEVYGGEDNAKKLTESAHSFGERYVFEHNGQLIIE